MIDKAVEYNLLQPWLGTGLLTSTGKKWRNRRKLLTPTFHFSMLEDFVPVFQLKSSVLVSNFKKSMDKPFVDIVPLVTACTLDIICQTAMGLNINAQEGGHTEYVNAIHEIGDAFFYRAMRPWLYPDFIFNLTAFGRRFNKHLKLVKGFTREVIREKKAFIVASGKWSPQTAPDGSPLYRRHRKAFLELLLDHHLKDPEFTEEDIREEVDTFMFEGHDTTAMALSWAIYLVGLDPKVQSEVHREMDDIFQGDVERDVDRADLTQMKYLECVIKETLRLFPSVPMLGRQVQKSLEISGYTVHKGSVCIIYPVMLHRDEESFPDPERFDPGRFLPENCAGRHPYAYVPFSAGPRNCIGQKFALMEEKTVLANIFRRFRVISLDARDKVRVTANLIIRNVDPLRVRFELR